VRLSSLGKRVESLERRLGGNRERDDSERFWSAMVGQEEKLYRQISNLRPFEEALNALWRASQTGAQRAVDKVWDSLSPIQRMLWAAHTALHEHIERRLKDPDLLEFDPAVWPDEVQKLVFEEVEK